MIITLKRSFIMVLLASFLLVGCGSEDYSERNKEEQKEGVDVSTETNTGTSVPDRKIIYEVDAELWSKDVESTVSMIKAELNEDEWLDSEERSEDYAALTIRVKSDRLDDFLDAISEEYQVSNFKRKATDVSIMYQDKSNLILTYEAERERLLELYENASLDDMIDINRRLSEIEIELQKLQGELNQFDSLVDYSEVKLKIYLHHEPVEEESLTFGDRVWNGLSGGFNALVLFLKGLVILVVTLLPWALVFVPLGYIIYRTTKRMKKKREIREIKNNEKKDQMQNLKDE